MATEQLFFAKVNAGTVFSENQGANQFIRVNGTISAGQNQLTSVTDVGEPYFGQAVIRPGMKLVASTAYPSGTTITSVDTGNNTITVSDNAAGGISGGLCRINCGPGMAFIESGSLTRPSGVSDWDFRKVTGSNDSEYSSGDMNWGVMAPVANSGGASARSGNFGQFQVFDVQARQQNTIANLFVTASGGNMNGFSGSFDFLTGDTTFALYQMDSTNQAGPIFNGTDISINDSYGFAAYQLAASNLMGAFVSGSGGGDAFPHTGSAQITGSLAITGSVDTLLNSSENFLIKNAAAVTQSLFKIDNEGVAVFRAREGSDGAPSAIVGGLYFTTSSAFIGVD